MRIQEANKPTLASTALKPVSPAIRVVTFLLGVALLALAWWMFTHYTALTGTSYTGGSLRNRVWYWLISIVWSRPTAVIVGLAGLFSCVAAFNRGVNAPDAAPAKAQPAPDIDSLLDSLRRGEPGAEPAFWNALFALPRWHFYSSASGNEILEKNLVPSLFVGVVDGQPMLHVFTSEARANTFGAKRQAAQGKADDSVALISLTPEAAIKYLLSLPDEVGHLLIDGAYFGARENMVALYALSNSISAREATERLGLVEDELPARSV